MYTVKDLSYFIEEVLFLKIFVKTAIISPKEQIYHVSYQKQSILQFHRES